MIIYTRDGGYLTTDVQKARDAIDRLSSLHPHGGGDDRYLLIELLHNYKCLLDVIVGNIAIFRHTDGSETRRIKLY